jgi:hypothetical protein
MQLIRSLHYSDPAIVPVPVLPPVTSLPSSTDTFDFFETLAMPGVLLGDLDWLNIESEENIRPRKRQNIITISRKCYLCSTLSYLRQ